MEEITQELDELWHPHIIGAKEGKHIRMQALKKSWTLYHNYRVCCNKGRASNKRRLLISVIDTQIRIKAAPQNVALITNLKFQYNKCTNYENIKITTIIFIIF